MSEGPFTEVCESTTATKRLYEIQLGKMLQNDSESQANGLVPYFKAKHVLWEGVTSDDLPEMWASPRDLAKYEVLPGDLLVSEGGDVGRAAIIASSPVPCIIQNALHRVRSETADVRFLCYALRVIHGLGWLDVVCNKATIAHLTSEKLGELRIPSVPLPTQKAIADFLDRKTAAIDALIEKKQKLLDLLAEKRAALINQAVTKGLDPKVPMKDSGLPWIGEIPAHWEVKRVKQLGNLKGGAGFPDGEQGVEGEDIPFLKVKHLATVGEGGTLDSSDDTVSVAVAARLRAHVFAAGTVVFAKVGAALLLRRYRLLGRPSCIDNNMLGFTVHEKVMNVGFLLPSLTLLPFDLLVNPGAVPSISAGQVGSFPLATPPVEEQRRIADHLRRALAKADKATHSISDQLHKLAEYRQALITAAVTGQLDIGEEAA